jgi:hypothetical protein
MGTAFSGDGKGEIGNRSTIIGCIEYGENGFVRHINSPLRLKNRVPRGKECAGMHHGSLTGIKIATLAPHASA